MATAARIADTLQLDAHDFSNFRAVQYGSEVYRYGPLALKRAFSLTGSSSKPGLCRIMYIGNCKVTCVIRSLSHYCARHSMSTGVPVCAPHGRVLIYLEWGRDKLWPRQV